MTPLRQRQILQIELASLRGLLHMTPDDPLATPLMQSRVEELEQKIHTLEQRPSLAPTTELFFTEGAALDSDGLEATFTSEILESYQNMVTNHYTAKNYGTPRRSGRRRHEVESQLFLTGLPRGSFGLQLSQPHIQDWVAATNVSQAMLDVSQLVEATVESDQAFETALANFDARVFKPLKRFIVALHAGQSECRLVTGLHETSLNADQITTAYDRVSAADTEERIIRLTGVFGGVITFTWKFDFQPDNASVIFGPLAEEVDDITAKEWNETYTQQRVEAELKESTVLTRTGKKKPTYELLNLNPLTTMPTRRALPPRQPPEKPQT